MPLAYVHIAVVIVHHAFAFLIIGKPKAFVTVVVTEVEGSSSVLLVLEPFAHVFLAVSEQVGTFALTFSLHVLAFVGITVLERGFSFSMRLFSFQFAHILATILKGVVPNLYLGRSGGYYRKEKNNYIDIFFHTSLKFVAKIRLFVINTELDIKNITLFCQIQLLLSFLYRNSVGPTSGFLQE